MPRARRLPVAGPCTVLLAVLAPSFAHAQAINTSLTVSGFPLALAPTGDDFLNGATQSSPVSFEVNATGGPANQTRTATVTLRCALPCPTSGSKPLSSLSWRRGDQGSWTALTTSDVVIEQRSMVRNGLNDPWGNTLLFRFLLDWEGDPPGTAASFDLVMTLTVTSP